MEIDDKEISIKPINLNNQIDQAKTNIKTEIDTSCLELTKSELFISVKDLEVWKNNILNKIYMELDKLKNNEIKNFESNKLNKNDAKTEIKIESKNKFNCFTSKDVQEENKEITRNFQNETYNYMNTNEKVENDIAAFFLKDVAKISRIAYKERKNLNKLMKENYIKLTGNQNSKDNENFKIEFSSWVKKYEKEKYMEEYVKVLNQVNLFQKKESKINQKFLTKLFHDLAIMYFHCDISFPSIEIDFTREDDFNSEKMIDFINRGKSRKVNFIILPALISNGNYLQNGKSWVFTFTKKTFKFDDSINKFLNNLLKAEKEENLNESNNKDNLTIKVSCEQKDDKLYIKINTNIDIPKDKDYKFIIHAKNKKTNIISLFKTKKKSLKIDKNFNIEKYESIIDGKVILTSTDILNKI